MTGGQHHFERSENIIVRLRHTFATMLLNNGCEIKVVSELLGHSNTKITEKIYIHVIQKQRVARYQLRHTRMMYFQTYITVFRAYRRDLADCIGVF